VSGGWITPEPGDPMISAGPDAQGRRPGLLARLVEAVRPGFRADELAFDPGDPVFGGKPCLVPGCERTACGHGLCQGTGSGGRQRAGPTPGNSPHRPIPGGGGRTRR
jgi:hypothetical protein